MNIRQEIDELDNHSVEVQMYFAIEPGWFWMIIPPGITSTGEETPEFACIYKGKECVALLRDRAIVDIKPNIDKNIVDTIISVNLCY
jgi:hypothetical protein